MKSTEPTPRRARSDPHVNAVGHGRTGQLVVLPTEGREVYESHEKYFTDEYQPKGHRNPYRPGPRRRLLVPALETRSREKQDLEALLDIMEMLEEKGENCNCRKMASFFHKPKPTGGPLLEEAYSSRWVPK